MTTITSKGLIFTYVDTESKTELIVGTNNREEKRNALIKENPPVKIIIPEYVEGKRVTIIGQCAFRYSDIRRVLIPASIKTICFDAFAYSNNLCEVRFAEGSELEKLDQGAFYSLPKLKELRIPLSVKTMTQFTLGRGSYENIYYCGNNNFSGINIFGDSSGDSIRHYPKRVFVKESYSSDVFGDFTQILKTNLCSVPIHEPNRCTNSKRYSTRSTVLIMMIVMSK